MANVNELKDIPDYKVDQKVAEYKSLGHTVEKIKQHNGKWTIRATKLVG